MDHDSSQRVTSTVSRSVGQPYIQYHVPAPTSLILVSVGRKEPCWTSWGASPYRCRILRGAREKTAWFPPPLAVIHVESLRAEVLVQMDQYQYQYKYMYEDSHRPPSLIWWMLITGVVSTSCIDRLPARPSTMRRGEEMWTPRQWYEPTYLPT